MMGVCTNILASYPGTGSATGQCPLPLPASEYEATTILALFVFFVYQVIPSSFW